jgi:hypothetical protein
MARIDLTAEEAAYIAERIACYEKESDLKLLWQAKYVTVFSVLPIYIDWTETIGICVDGTVVTWSTEGDYQGTQECADQLHIRTALVQGTKRYPKLESLIPPRPANAHTCEAC